MWYDEALTLLGGPRMASVGVEVLLTEQDFSADVFAAHVGLMNAAATKVLH